MEAGGAGRLRQLDGLRGLAALVVVLHHGLLVAPALGEQYRNGHRVEPVGTAWWLTRTPLHLLWDGTSAVLLFFVLSGFVLSLPYVAQSSPSWAGYYPRRLVRLYLPTWAALGFAVVLAWLVPRVVAPGQGMWLAAHAVPVTWGALAQDAVLVSGTGWLNSPLWSLRWEVLFSLLLPVYVLLGRWLARLWPLVLAGLLLLTLNTGTATGYLPIFGIGVLFAVRQDLLDVGARRLPGWAWPFLGTLALALVNAQWYPVPLPGAPALAVAGTALVVWVCYAWPLAQRVCRSRPVAWLGERSFSLYLVHEPIVVSVALALRTQDPRVVMAIALPLSLLAAEVFHRLVERPAHRLSKLAGARSSALAAEVRRRLTGVAPVSNPGTAPDGG